MQKKIGFIKESFTEIIRYKQRGLPIQFDFLERGYYFEMLRRYFQFFDPAQLKIFLYEDLQNDPLRLMRDMFEFLEVDASFTPDISIKYNVTANLKENSLKKLYKEILSYNDPCEEISRREFTPIYRADILMLQDLLGRDLSAWLK